MNKNKYLKEEKAFFFRFLKEKGVYSAFIKYIHTPHTFGYYQVLHKDWTFDAYVARYGTEDSLTGLIGWHQTSEGFLFWSDIYREYASKKKIFFHDFLNKKLKRKI